MSLVFDSSALLAFLRNETGADAVYDLMTDADVPKFAHSVNLCEVFYRVAIEDGEDAAHEDIADLFALASRNAATWTGSFGVIWQF